MKSRYLALALILAACSRDKEPQTDTSIAAVTPTAEAPTPVQRISNPCAHTGLWSECSLERRLKQSGFVVKKLDESPARPGFTINPVVYSLGASRLEVFFYADEASVNKDLVALDTIAVTPRGAQSPWPSAPVLIRSANLAAVLLTQNQRQAERVVLAITAGAPQPGSPR